MSSIHKYRALEQKHVKEIQDWINSDPKNLANLHGHIGTNRTPADYVGEYGDRFAIAGYLAGDIGCPYATRMMKEYKPFGDLEGVAFGN